MTRVINYVRPSLPVLAFPASTFAHVLLNLATELSRLPTALPATCTHTIYTHTLPMFHVESVLRPAFLCNITVSASECRQVPHCSI